MGWLEMLTGDGLFSIGAFIGGAEPIQRPIITEKQMESNQPPHFVQALRRVAVNFIASSCQQAWSSKLLSSITIYNNAFHNYQLPLAELEKVRNNMKIVYESSSSHQKVQREAPPLAPFPLFSV